MKNIKLNAEQIVEDCKTMSVKEVSTKHNCAVATVYQMRQGHSKPYIPKYLLKERGNVERKAVTEEEKRRFLAQKDRVNLILTY